MATREFGTCFFEQYAQISLSALLRSEFDCLVNMDRPDLQSPDGKSIGIPFGVQLFKLGTYALWPFGHVLVDGPNEPGCVSVVMNLIWILCGWWEIAIIHFAFGLLFCVTIVGIPWGMQHFKMAIATVFPFGKEIRN